MVRCVDASPGAARAGGHDGLGPRRAKELLAATRVLGLSDEHVHVVDAPDLAVRVARPPVPSCGALSRALRRRTTPPPGGLPQR